MTWRRNLLASALATSVVACGLVSGLACGPSNAEIRRSENVTYGATFPVVWNVVQEEVLRRYAMVADEDPIGGSLLTGWRLIEATDELGTSTTGAAGGGNASSNSSTAAPTAGGATVGVNGSGSSGAAPGAQAAQQNARTTGMPLIPGYYMRIKVNVLGPPWRIKIDGEAVEYKIGMSMLVPFHHGYADEPTWLVPRVQILRYAIYDRLRKYAIDDVPVSPKVKKKNDSGTWDKLPDHDAAQVIADVRAAARARDLTALQERMDPAFTWSPGAEGSADTAIMMWNADPSRLASLVSTLDAGCAVAPPAATVDVVCPANAHDDASGQAHAVFRKEGVEWRFVLFVP